LSRISSLPDWALALPGAALAALIAFLALRVGPVAPMDAPAKAEWCSSAPEAIHASEVHFSPGLLQHQSWVAFPVNADFSGSYMLCLDGRLLRTGGGRRVFSSGTAVFNLSTAWVDVQFLRGALEPYRDLQRWELRLIRVNRRP
jgi:hypothetical protein